MNDERISWKLVHWGLILVLVVQIIFYYGLTLFFS
jgi:hypothetical protein